MYGGFWNPPRCVCAHTLTQQQNNPLNVACICLLVYQPISAELMSTVFLCVPQAAHCPAMEKMKRIKKRLSLTLRSSQTIDESLSELAEQMTIEDGGTKDNGKNLTYCILIWSKPGQSTQTMGLLCITSSSFAFSFHLLLTTVYYHQLLAAENTKTFEQELRRYVSNWPPAIAVIFVVSSGSHLVFRGIRP